MTSERHPRRTFLQRVGGVAALATVGTGEVAAAPPADAIEFETNPFRIGVGSGDPLPESVVLWTRLVPEPLEPGGGMPEETVSVRWEVATDETTEDVVASGDAPARSELAHSVHVPRCQGWIEDRRTEEDRPFEPFEGKSLHHSRCVSPDMATVSDSEGGPPDGVEFVHEDDGRVTARHIESGVASFGDTEAEALRQLADALDSHFGNGDGIDDPEAYLAERGIDAEIGEAGPPPWLE